MTQDRTLPHNLEAERAVLGAIMLRAEAYERSGKLRPDDFFRDAHRRIFRQIQRLLEERAVPPDFITLRDALSQAGDLDEVGGPAYLASLVDGIPASANVRHYADLIREKSLARRLIHGMNEVAASAYDGDVTADVLLERADRMVLDLQSGNGHGRMARLADGSAGLMGDLEERVATRGRLRGIGTGFKSLDDLTLGWQSGDLIVVAARPSIGKTIFVLTSALAAGRAGKRVAIFSLEMKRRQLEYRLASSLSEVPLTRILQGSILSVEMPKISAALCEIGNLPISIDDRAGLDFWDVRWTCRRLKAEGGVDLVVIDYVQLMRGSLERRGANRNEEITDISRRLKILADELDAPILLVSQLNRASADRADNRPRLSDLRESGALEQDSDIVLLLHRKNHREGGVTNLIIEKQRNGPTGTINVTLEREIVTFRDGGEEPHAPAADEEQPTPGSSRRRYLRAR